MPDVAKEKIDIPIERIKANLELQIQNKKIELDILQQLFKNKIKTAKSEINE
jgi:hypothetical protein